MKRIVLALASVFALFGKQASAGQGMSGMLLHEDNDALLPWRDFENSYNLLFSTEGQAQSPGATREFIQLTVQQIPSYTRNTGLSKHDVDLRKGTSKLVNLMNEIPEIGKRTNENGVEGKKECKLQELSQRIVFETIFASNVHVNSFLKYYNSLFFNFCINDIDRDIIRLTGLNDLLLPDTFEDMKKSQSQAAKDLHGADAFRQLARGLTLYLKSNKHNVERASDKPKAHLKRILDMVHSEIYTEFYCKELKPFFYLLPKYKLVSSFKNELSDDSRKWIDVIDLCDKLYNFSEALVLVDLYELEAARLSTIIFMPANSPEFQHHNPADTEEVLELIIDTLDAKKRLFREDHRVSISKLEEIKFTLQETSKKTLEGPSKGIIKEKVEFCTIINVQKLQQLLAEYAGLPNVANYLLHKAKKLIEMCKHRVNEPITENAKDLDASDVNKLTSLRLRIADAIDPQLKKRMHNLIPVESFIEGTMAFLLSNVYAQEDGFDIIAKYLVPKTTEERQTMREGAYLLLGEFCDKVESNFAEVRKLFIEFDKLSDDPTNFDEPVRDWMANVNICSMIKFGSI